MRREEGSEAGDSLDAAGPSIRRLVDKMQDYILPPKFDFINNPLAEPIVMYMFEFEYKFDKDDLSYMWQNLAPRDHEKTYKQTDVVVHELFDTELLNERNLMENPDLRWMLFKVKQKSQKVYRDKVLSEYGTWTADPITDEASISEYKLLPNWPYDYLSIVELIKVEAEVLYKDPMEEIDEILVGSGLEEIEVAGEDLGMLGSVDDSSHPEYEIPGPDSYDLGDLVLEARRGDASALGRAAKLSKKSKAKKSASTLKASTKAKTTASKQKSSKVAESSKTTAAKQKKAKSYSNKRDKSGSKKGNKKNNKKFLGINFGKTVDPYE